MAKIYPLFSSSSGNCTYIGDNDSGILVDAGVSCKKICDALTLNGLKPQAIRGILITHTHSDHISGLKVLTKKYRIPVFAQRTNLEILAANSKVSPESELYEISDRQFYLGDFAVTAFETPHDTPASCGYRIETADSKQCAVCTDLGYVTPKIDSELKRCDVVLLESNYDEKMLMKGDYPYELKKRIRSDHGHLSNHDCANQLTQLINSGVCKFILGHLSPHNNTPLIAETNAVSALKDFKRDKDYILHIAKPDGCKMAVTL